LQPGLQQRFVARLKPGLQNAASQRQNQQQCGSHTVSSGRSITVGSPQEAVSCLLPRASCLLKERPSLAGRLNRGTFWPMAQQTTTRAGKAFVYTIGCQMNELDSELAMATLEGDGLNVA